MNAPYTYIMNWKMELSYQDASAYASFLHDMWTTNNAWTKNTIVICPSFDALTSVSLLLKNSSLALGAQDCSSHALGPYTGEVCAQSLAQIGCTYCIIGHSERRHSQHEETPDVAQKLVHLIQYDVIPIICIGETRQERDRGMTFYSLEKQIAPLLEIINLSDKQIKHVYIAYEPTWAIGSNEHPDMHELQEIFEVLHQWCSSYTPHIKCTLLYGGGVNESTAPLLKSIPLIQGFLIGRASLDFKKFETIVLS